MIESEVMRNEVTSSTAGVDGGAADFGGDGVGFGPVAVGVDAHPATARPRATTREQRPFAITYRYVSAAQLVTR
jgi:hypothetical protein